MKKRIILFVIVLISIILISGCIGTDYDFTINKIIKWGRCAISIIR